MADKKLLLSRLMYEVTIDSIVLPYNSEFYGKSGYHAFLQKQDYFTTNSDYAMQYRKAFPAVNMAIARLQQYEKLPYFYEKLEVKCVEGEYVADLSKVDYLEIVNAFKRTGNGKWINYAFTIQEEKLVIQGRIETTETNESGEKVGRIEIEYAKNIPIFSEDDIVVDSIDSDNAGTSYNDNNVDLREYGFTTLDYQFVKLWAEAQIVQELDVTTGFNKLQLAENYFADLVTHKPTFTQRNIQRRF